MYTPQYRKGQKSITVGFMGFMGLSSFSGSHISTNGIDVNVPRAPIGFCLDRLSYHYIRNGNDCLAGGSAKLA